MTELAESRWPLAVRLELLPGRNLTDRFELAARCGFDAVELPGRTLAQYRDELLSVKDRLPLPVSSISLGFRGSLLSIDRAVRQQCRQDIMMLFDLCAQLNAVGLVMPPALKQDCNTLLHDAGSTPDVQAARDELLLVQLPELAAAAADRGVCLFLEPVNRSETDYIYTVEHAASLCEQIDHPGLGITIDLHHMRLGSEDIPETIRHAARWIRHVHLADGQRCEPRAGVEDDASVLLALYEAGYEGYWVIEARQLTGVADVVLRRAAQYLRRLMNQITAPVRSTNCPD